MLQIYPTDQSVSSYSSNPSTPVSSPPPLTGAGSSGPGWAPGAAPVSPHFTADPNHGTIHMVRKPRSSKSSAFFITVRIIAAYKHLERGTCKKNHQRFSLANGFRGCPIIVHSRIFIIRHYRRLAIRLFLWQSHVY